MDRRFSLCVLTSAAALSIVFLVAPDRKRSVVAPVNDAAEDDRESRPPASPQRAFGSPRVAISKVKPFVATPHSPTLRGVARFESGLPVADTPITWRDPDGKVYYSAETDAEGRWQVPDQWCSVPSATFLRIHVNDHCHFDCRNLVGGAIHSISLPDLGRISVQCSQEAEPGDGRSLVLSLAEPESRAQYSWRVGGGTSATVATLGIDSDPLAFDGATRELMLPRQVLYSITCQSTTASYFPAAHYTRSPGAVAFAFVESRGHALLELVDRGLVAELDGEAHFVTGSSTRTVLVKDGVAVCPAATLPPGSRVVVSLGDGRIFDRVVADLPTDVTRRSYRLELEGTEPPAVALLPDGFDAPVRLVFGRLGDGTLFFVSDATSMRDEGIPFYVRRNKETWFYRLPEAWSDVWLMSQEGVLLWAARSVRDRMVLRAMPMERILSVDFDRAVEPLVASHGRVLLRFEVRLPNAGTLPWLSADAVSVRTGEECRDARWNKVVPRGVSARITARYWVADESRSIVLAE